MNAQPDQAVFDEAASAFADYGTTIRGYLRYKLTQRNLEAHLPKNKSLTVLDIGGGSGPDAAWLAERGHRVTMIEPSVEQRNYAQRRFNYFLSERIRSNITLIPGSLEVLEPGAKFDMVLEHGVAMYLSEPEVFIRQATQFLKRGGLFSLLEKGYYGALGRAIHERNFEDLQSLKTSRRVVNHIGQDTYSFTPDELESIINEAGLKVLQWHGVRVFSDTLSTEVAAMDRAVLDEIIETEYEQGLNPSIRGSGQMLHFVARKK